MENKVFKITEKLISIPPYLSASWAAVAHIRTMGDRLVFTMKDGEAISVPGFPEPLIKQVFEFHMKHLETEVLPITPRNFRLTDGMMPPPELFKMGMATPEMVNMMQHNSDQKNIPNLPDELIDKISKILKIVAPVSDPEMFPKPEPHCNCPYCQIARALYDIKEDQGSAPHVEEMVTAEELTFTQYHIVPAGEKLYQVTDKLFPAERFTVFLGEPVGCTCGKTGCEHLIAVLKS